MRLICVLLTICVLGETPAYADDSLDVEILTVLDCEIIPQNGEDLCGLDFAEWQRLLKTNAALASARRLLQYEQDRIKVLADQKVAMKKQIEAFVNSQEVMTMHIDKLTKDHIALDKKYQYEREKPRLGNYVGWTVAAVATVILGGVLIKDLLE